MGNIDMHQPRIQIQEVSKVFNGRPHAVTALENINLDVYPGELVSIIGPSGCGKSTLLKLIAGFDTWTDGRILVDGQPVTAPSYHRTMIFQEHNIFPWKTALQNIEFGLKAQGIPPEQRTARAQHYISLMQLNGFEHQYPHQLSGGMRQRVAIARALVIKPSCVLMDEPFGALDSQLRSTLQDEMLTILDREKTTVLFVTHDIEEAIYLSDRVAILSPRPGRIRQIISTSLPRPRKPGLKLEPRFQELKSVLLAELGNGQQSFKN